LQFHGENRIIIIMIYYVRAYLTCYNTAVSRVVVIITVSTFQKHFIIRPRKALLLVVSVAAITIYIPRADDLIKQIIVPTHKLLLYCSFVLRLS